LGLSQSTQVMMVMIVPLWNSITDGPGYFKTLKEPVVIMQEAGGKNQSFHGRLFDVFNL